MAKGENEKANSTIELSTVPSDPVLANLRLAEEQYKVLSQEWNSQLRAARDEAKGLAAGTATLEQNLQQAQDRAEKSETLLRESQAQVERMQTMVAHLEEELQASRDQVEREHVVAQQYSDRAALLSSSLKEIHKALFEGGVYSLILKACLAITGATRGLYVTTRGGVDSIRIRAAQDIDGYPDSPPSEFVKALCRKVLENNDSFVCNSEADLKDLPKPERRGEHFQNLIVSPVVLLHTLNGVIIAADKLNGDFEEDDVVTLLSVGDQASVAVQNQHLQREMQNSYIATVSMLADAVEAKDPYTHGHCDLVSRYARLTAERLKLSDEDRSIICYSALLHDVGKIGVSGGVLNKPGPLLPEERDLMRAHVRVGHDLLSKVPALGRVAEVVLHHHEWYDGSGYPDGLVGEEIPIASRIVCVVDAYCAMITKRSYKEAYSTERAKEELLRCAGTQFDQRVVEAFLEVLDSPEGQNVEEDDEDITCGVLPDFVNAGNWQHMGI